MRGLGGLSLSKFCLARFGDIAWGCLFLLLVIYTNPSSSPKHHTSLFMPYPPISQISYTSKLELPFTTPHRPHPPSIALRQLTKHSIRCSVPWDTVSAMAYQTMLLHPRTHCTGMSPPELPSKFPGPEAHFGSFLIVYLRTTTRNRPPNTTTNISNF